VFYVNSIVWWQLLEKEAIDWQGTWVSRSAKDPQLQVPATSGTLSWEQAGALKGCREARNGIAHLDSINIDSQGNDQELFPN
jgi:hypothetical protein